MKSTSVLDCENYESILTSIESIYATPKNEFIAFLKSISIEEINNSQQLYVWPHEYLFQIVKKRFEQSSNNIEAYWFHNTRVPKYTNFSEGILPLDKVKYKIEQLIDSIAAKLAFSVIGKDLSQCDTIQQKLLSKTNAGPWGFLIKNFAFELPVGIHNYLKCPEIVQDIIKCKYRNSYEEILSEFKKQTISCVIKFKSVKTFHPDNLMYVINYLYHKENNLPLNIYCNTNTSNSGNVISNELIDSIEYFHE